MAFLTDAQTLADLSDTLQVVGVSNLPAWWTSINTSSHARAYNHIVTCLTAKGFTLAQILAWDQGADYERSLTLYFALSRGGSLQNLDNKFIKTFDLRQDLADLPGLTNAGAFVDPAGTAGQVHVGQQDTSNDIFVEDWDSPDLGTETHW